MVCDENLREAYGIHTSDQRSSATVLKHTWPDMHLASNVTEEDKLWRSDQRETMHALRSRICTFFEYNLPHLLNQFNVNVTEDQAIIVVSHGVWIECCMHMYTPNALRIPGRSAPDRVYNANLFEGKYHPTAAFRSTSHHDYDKKSNDFVNHHVLQECTRVPS